MGISHRAATKRKIKVPMRLDLLAKEMCRCKCHDWSEANPHPGKHCTCNPGYKVDGHASVVIQ